ncbi:MAG: hypothetical protein EOP18_07345, partial [Rhizobiaceae bacterium]
MNYTLPLLAMLLAPGIAPAAELHVSHAGVVKPDAELRATVTALSDLAARGRVKDIGKVEAFFAPDVKSFTRSLDPFQPWTRVDDISGHYLTGVADTMVEQGELAAGMPVPDYRLEAMKMIASLVGEGTVFGTLDDAPGAICAPAAYRVDRKAALAFAKKFELDAYSLRFFDADVVLAEKPKAKKGKAVPAGSLLMFDYRADLPEGWGYYETAGGVKGYMADREDTLGLSQNHV